MSKPELGIELSQGVGAASTPEVLGLITASPKQSKSALAYTPFFTQFEHVGSTASLSNKTSKTGT